MIECPACRVKYVDNTLFCTECGLYLPGSGQPGTDPLETRQVPWMGEADHCHVDHKDLPDTGPLLVRLRIGARRSAMGYPPGQPAAGLARLRPAGLPAGLPLGGALRRVNQRARSPRGDYAGREVEMPLVKPIRLGRIDPIQSIYPEIDLTDDLALEYGVSRRHACIFRRGNAVEVEDLGSINGTLLNGKRLAPYIPEPLKDGDQIQLGKLLIEVCLQSPRLPKNTSGHFPTRGLAA